jgi:hypothetical protein
MSGRARADLSVGRVGRRSAGVAGDGLDAELAIVRVELYRIEVGSDSTSARSSRLVY